MQHFYQAVVAFVIFGCPLFQLGGQGTKWLPESPLPSDKHVIITGGKWFLGAGFQPDTERKLTHGSASGRYPVIPWKQQQALIQMDPDNLIFSSLVRIPYGVQTFGCIYSFKNSPNASDTTPGLYVFVFNMNGTMWDFFVYKTGERHKTDHGHTLSSFLKRIPNNKIVAIALQGDIGVGRNSLVYTTVEDIGGLKSTILRNVNRREAYAFITITGKGESTQEKHVPNPYKMSYVETGYLTLETKHLQFRVNSKVYKTYRKKQGIDVAVVPKEFAHPIIQLNTNTSSWRAGERVVVRTGNYGLWTNAEEKTIDKCSSCQINEMQLTEPLGFLYQGKTPYDVEKIGKDDASTSKVYITGFIENVCDLNYSECGHPGVGKSSTSDTVRPSETELERASEQIKKNVYAPKYLYVGDCGLKGRGVFTKTDLPKGSYVVYFHSRLLTEQPEKGDIYLFELVTPIKTFWFDASKEDGSYARLLNDNHTEPNLYPQAIRVNDRPYIAFFASRDIRANEELTYDYGGHSEALWWRKTDQEPTIMAAKPRLQAEDQIRKKVNAPDYLYVGYCGLKGRGVFTKEDISKNSYVLYYHGQRPTAKPEDETYLLQITNNAQTVWIDSSQEDGSYGRLLNDDHKLPNLYTKVVHVDGETHVAFYALRDIRALEELTYSYIYGGSSARYWWRTPGQEYTSTRKSPLKAADQIRRNVYAPDYLYVGDSGYKGRGVYTKNKLNKGSYVIFYHGKRCTKETEGDDTYVFELDLETKIEWIDATEEDGSYGRLMNDNHINPNLESEIVHVDGEAHIAFFALRDIEPGEELTYDYGGDPNFLWWRNPGQEYTSTLKSLPKAANEIRRNVYAPDYLYVGDCGYKGRGVYTKIKLNKGSYVIFYHGKRCTEETEGDDTYVFELDLETKIEWIDATEEDGSYGRLMNDNHINPNLESEIVDVDGEAHIAFFALRDIEPGEELTYDYGGNPDVLWWRNTDIKKRSNIHLSARDQISKNVYAPDYLSVEGRDKKGRGVFTKVDLTNSSYVLYYHGKRVTMKPKDEDNTFEIIPNKLWIDASVDDGSYGRLMNDNMEDPNLLSQVIYIHGEPHIAFFAIRDIPAGEELTYDYGGGTSGHRWRKRTFQSPSKTSLLIAKDQIRNKVIAPDYLYVGYSGTKGRGIYTQIHLLENSYIMFYHGKHVTEYPEDDDTYLFELLLDEEIKWLNANDDDGSYGRLLNDDHINPNMQSEIVEVDNESYVAFFAQRDIEPGEELTFDYGGDHGSYPWRKTRENHAPTGKAYDIARDQIKKKISMPDYLYIGDSGQKGRGIFAKTDLLKNSYVLYYHGKMKTEKPEGSDTYLFEIQTDKTTWIDASEEDGSYGRLVNDDHKHPNLMPDVVYVGDEAHIAFFALRDIKTGEELTFDHGGDSEPYFWRHNDHNKVTTHSSHTTNRAYLSAGVQIRKNIYAPDYLYVGDCGSKGRGIFTNKRLPKDSYVTYYHGKRRTERPVCDERYLFTIRLPTHTVWIDASEEDGSYGRLINDDPQNPNLKLEILNIGEEAHAAFFALRDIEVGEELTFDYGGSSEKNLWRENKNRDIRNSARPFLSAVDQISKNVIAPDYLYIGDCGQKGRGVFTKTDLLKSSYVLFYHGKRPKERPLDDTYLFEVFLQTHAVWIDGSEEDGSYGRLLNDDHANPNLYSEIVYIGDVVHIAFFALRNIYAGEELTYNYDDDGRGCWWREGPDEIMKKSTIPDLSAVDQITKAVISPDYLYVGDAGEKGRGIFTKVFIPKNSYVLYYHGARSTRKPDGEETYFFEITHGTRTVWIDASEEDGSFSRLMNDDHRNPNLDTKIVEFDDDLYVAFFANRDIKAWEEITFDYGGDAEGYPWRSD